MRHQSFLDLDMTQTQTLAPRTVAGWNALALQAIAADGAAAPAAARALAVLHTCMYNAWAAYDDVARQTPRGFAVRLPRVERSPASKACAMGHAAYLVLADLFPARRASFDAHFVGLGLDAGPADLLSPAGIGRTQAACMLDARRASEATADGDVTKPLAYGRTPADWCRMAREASACAAYDDERDVLLYFALAGAMADALAAPVAAPGGASSLTDAAATEALRRFTGEARWAEQAASDEPGRQIGALAFDRARRYWQGKP